MRIGTNVLSMNARQSLYEKEKRMNIAMEHLATGKKLNYASDNPANIAIVTRMQERMVCAWRFVIMRMQYRCFAQPKLHFKL